jgi:hypothetical protein
MPRSARLLALSGLGATVLLWSSAFVAIRVALRDTDSRVFPRMPPDQSPLGT